MDYNLEGDKGCFFDLFCGKQVPTFPTNKFSAKNAEKNARVIMGDTQPNEKLLRNGVELIAAERKRQVTGKGYTPDHDDQHARGELALVAALLASPELLYKERNGEGQTGFVDPWPESWERRWDQRPYFDKNGRPNHDVTMGTQDRIRQLQKAGALIAAEIDRLLRIQANVADCVTDQPPVER